MLGSWAAAAVDQTGVLIGLRAFLSTRSPHETDHDACTTPHLVFAPLSPLGMADHERRLADIT